MGDPGQFDTVVSSVWVREGEKELVSPVVGLVGMVRLSLADGRGGRVDCDVDLDDVIRSRRGGNGDAQG